MKRLLLYIIPLIVIGVGVAYFVYNKPHKDIAGSKADLTISATELYNAFESDEQAANAKYLDKVVAVKGVVKDVSGGDDDSKQIILDTGNPLASISCSMDHLSEHKGFSAIQNGDQVTLKGICTGMLMDVVIDRAVIVN